MTVKDEAYVAEKKITRPWPERLIVPMLVVGALLTLLWILALMGLAWQIVSVLTQLSG